MLVRLPAQKEKKLCARTQDPLQRAECANPQPCLPVRLALLLTLPAPRTRTIIPRLRRRRHHRRRKNRLTAQCPWHDDVDGYLHWIQVRMQGEGVEQRALRECEQGSHLRVAEHEPVGVGVGVGVCG